MLIKIIRFRANSRVLNRSRNFLLTRAMRSLSAHEAWAFESAQQGANFAELCEGLLEWISQDQVAIIAAGFLRQWINDELVTTIEY